MAYLGRATKQLAELVELAELERSQYFKTLDDVPRSRTVFVKMSSRHVRGRRREGCPSEKTTSDIGLVGQRTGQSKA